METKSVKKHFAYDGYDNNVRAYGLSDNADQFDNNDNGVYSNTFLWYVMRCDFIKGFEWAISFVNYAIRTFAENKTAGNNKYSYLFS